MDEVVNSNQFPTRIIVKLCDEIWQFAFHFLNHIPGRAGKLSRRIFYRLRRVQIGKGLVIDMRSAIIGNKIQSGGNLRIGRGVMLYAQTGEIRIGRNVEINSGSSLDANDGGTIILGNDVLLGENIIVRASSHKYADTDIPINQQGHSPGMIEVGDDVWVGSGVILVPGASIGSHSVIAAGSVVTRALPPYSVCAGNPAKPIRLRKPNSLGNTPLTSL